PPTPKGAHSKARGRSRRNQLVGAASTQLGRTVSLGAGSWRLGVALGQLPDPDIPEADRLTRIAVRLQLDRRGVVLLVRRLPDVERLAFELEVILHQHAV